MVFGGGCSLGGCGACWFLGVVVLGVLVVVIEGGY